jgi:branched-chain amino acid transport system ATP-binding protein
VFENCRLCAQAAHPRPLALLGKRRPLQDQRRRASAALQAVGLSHLAAAAGGLAQPWRQAAAGDRHVPGHRTAVLLLDEPLAGMGAEETDRMLQVLQQLKAGHAILLVEHDMDAVFRIAERITVMVNGEVIASASPEAIRNNRDVQLAYLGGHA